MNIYFGIKEKNSEREILLKKLKTKYSDIELEEIFVSNFKQKNDKEIVKKFLNENDLKNLKRTGILFQNPFVAYYFSETEFVENYKMSVIGSSGNYNFIKEDLSSGNLTFIKEIPFKKVNRKKEKTKTLNLKDLMFRKKDLERLTILNESLEKKIDPKKFTFLEEKSERGSNGKWRNIAFVYEDIENVEFSMDIQSFKECKFKLVFLNYFKSKKDFFEEEILSKLKLVKKGDLDINKFDFVDMDISFSKFRIGISNIKIFCHYTKKEYLYNRQTLMRLQLTKEHKKDLTIQGKESSPIVKRLLSVAKSNGKNIENIEIVEFHLKNEKINKIIYKENDVLFLQSVSSFQSNIDNAVKVDTIKSTRKELKQIKLELKKEKRRKEEELKELKIKLRKEKLEYKKTYKENKTLRKENKQREKVETIFQELSITNYKILDIYLYSDKFTYYKVKFMINGKVFTRNIVKFKRLLQNIIFKDFKTYFIIGKNTNNDKYCIKVGRTFREEGVRVSEINKQYTFEYPEQKIHYIEGDHELKIRDFLLDKIDQDGLKSYKLFSNVKSKRTGKACIEFYDIDRLEDINEYLEPFCIKLNII